MSTAHRDSQWDIRVNIPCAQSLDNYLEHLHKCWDLYNIRYLSCSGLEETPSETRHVHVALVLGNATSKASVVRKFILNKKDGYYCEARDREKGSLHQWLEYHRKKSTKVDPENVCLLELGQLPRQRTRDLPRAEREALKEDERNARCREAKDHLQRLRTT